MISEKQTAICNYLHRKGFGDEALDYCFLREDAGHSGLCEGQCDTCQDEHRSSRCPDCQEDLFWFNDYGIEYQYCPTCNDFAYGEHGENLGRME